MIPPMKKVAQTSMTQPWHIQLFGGLRLRQAERTITRFRTQKIGALLAYLAYFRLRAHPRETLIDMLWPDAEPESGRHSLSLALSSLRHLLEPPGVPSGTVIVADRLTVELNPAAFLTDVAQFEAALRNAAQAKSDKQRLESLTQALDNYSGTLLPGSYEEWIVAERARIAERFQEAARQGMRLLEKAGEPSRAVEIARRAVEADPLREEAHRELMRLYAAAGEPAAAGRQYRE